ncbi:ankyrin repeat domain-containing protein [Formosa sp. S-31]|uniref:ankyrin repeat domain-containing protein n=1 Tax=Formosa sp. S-31 TaxID=2790949 RepID=UPI003EB6FEB3
MKNLSFKKGVLGAFLSVGLFAQAQQSNVFLERDFWKSNPSVEVVKEKIKAGNDPTERNSASFDPVTLAILQGLPDETIEYLITQKGNDVNKLTHDGRTYIFWAANKGKVELMEYLLERGAKTDLLDNHGFTVLNFAAATGQSNTKVYDLCLENGANLQSDLDHHGANALLLVSQRAKDFNTIYYFVSKGLDINGKDAEGNGIFHYVAKSGNIDMLNQLIEKGIDYNYKNNEGGNAMMFASMGGRGTSNGLELFKFLESKGISPNVTTSTGETPLHALGGKSKDAEIINYFIAKGVDVNQADQNGNTAFLNAASRNTLDIVKLLAKEVKTINATNKKGESALALAVQNNSAAVVTYLINNGADVNVLDAEGNNLIAYLIQGYSERNSNEFKQKLELLKQKGLDVSKPQNNGNTVYHLALDKNSLDLLKQLAPYGVNVNAKNKDGMTALLKASMSATDDVILKYLIGVGADKSITTDFDETAFDLANENELLKANKININFLK